MISLLVPDSPTTLSALRTTLQTRGHLRLAPALPEAFAVACLRVLRATPHTATQHVDPDSGHQLWRYAWEPGTDCTDHPLCDLGHALAVALPQLVGHDLTTGLPLVSDVYRKGAFADPFDARTHSATLTARERPATHLALLHLTTQAWPRTWGGHLEASGGEAFAPAWNTLDLIDLMGPMGLTGPTAHPRLRLPLLEHHVGPPDGFTVSVALHL